jgi:hypothetical protein
MDLNIYTQQKIPSDNAISQPVKDYRTFYEYATFITMFKTHHLPYNQRVKTVHIITTCLKIHLYLN